MDYGLKRGEAYRQLGFEEEYRDVIMCVLHALVEGEDIRDEDREFLKRYMQVKIDIPKEEIPEGNIIAIQEDAHG